MLIIRINKYIENRAIKIKKRGLFRRVPTEPVIPVSEVQIIVAMVLAGNINKYFDEYDQMVAKEKRTQDLPPRPQGKTKMPEYKDPPPPPEVKVVELDLSGAESK